jgi:hypothetical protein
MNTTQLQQQLKSRTQLFCDGVYLPAGPLLSLLIPAYILLFLFILPINCLNAQERRSSRNVLFGVPLSGKAKSLLAEVEEVFGKPVREEWLKAEDGLGAMAGESKVDDDGTPVILLNPANGGKLDVIVHELYHFKLRAEGYPIVRWLYPSYMDTEANRAAFSQLEVQLYDPILHYIFYGEVRSWGINPGETFENRTKQALRENALAAVFTNMDQAAIALYYFKIELEVNDPVLIQRLQQLLERKQKQSGMAFGKRLSQIVIDSNPRSPKAAIDIGGLLKWTLRREICLQTKPLDIPTVR